MVLAAPIFKWMEGQKACQVFAWRKIVEKRQQPLATVTGKVEATTKAAKKGAFGMLVNDVWYNSPDDLNEYWNKQVSFETGKKPGDQRTWIRGDITVTGGNSSGGGNRGGGRSYGGGGGGNDGRSARIEHQHSQEMAITFVALLLQYDALPLGAKAAKPAARETLMREAVDRYTVKFANDLETRAPFNADAAVAADNDEPAANDDFVDEPEAAAVDDGWED